MSRRLPAGFISTVFRKLLVLSTSLHFVIHDLPQYIIEDSDDRCNIGPELMGPYTKTWSGVVLIALISGSNVEVEAQQTSEQLTCGWSWDKGSI